MVPDSNLERLSEDAMKDYYIQPDAPDPVLDEATIMGLVCRHLPDAKAVTAVDESGGEARTYRIDDRWILKMQRPQQLRPRTSLKKEVFFLNQLRDILGISVPSVLGHGREGQHIEYTLMTRMDGVAIKHADLGGEDRQQALFELGRMLRRIHALPQQPFVDSRLLPGDHSPVDVRWRFGNVFDEVLDLIRERSQSWDFSLDPVTVSRRAMRFLPDVDVWVALHSNPGPEHVFVNPETRRLSGIIDFGDAYFGHPVNDLRRWRSPEDREAIFAGYIHGNPVSDNFIRTWKVAQVLTDVIALSLNPELRQQVTGELERVLGEFE
jgi:aminoglycoside phosphotransferase (APT) family kinase protein